MRIHAFHHLYQDRLRQSTKPFLARGSKISRCEYCQVAEQYCLCAVKPDIDSPLAALLIVSSNEVFKPSNTGRLIADTIKETYVYQWHRTEPDLAMLALLQDPTFFPIVVFPAQSEADQSRQLDFPSQLEDGRKPLLIFIDGSWREAKRIFRQSTYLHPLPLLSIEPEKMSAYLMRKTDNDQHLATAEVASLVFNLCGDPQAAEALELWFAVFKESYLLTKSQKSSVSMIQRPALSTWLKYNAA